MLDQLLVQVNGKTKAQIRDLADGCAQVFRAHGIDGTVIFKKFKAIAITDVNAGGVYPRTPDEECMLIFGLNPKDWFGSEENNIKRTSLLRDLCKISDIRVSTI